MITADIDEFTKLVPLELRHADEIFQVVDAHREDLREWLPWVDRTRAVGDVHEFLRTATEKQANGDGLTAGFWNASQFAGVFDLHSIDHKNARTSIGYWLAPPYRGRGYMTKACRLMLDHAFNELELNRVVIQCAVENLKSRAIPERLGFVNEGTLRQSERLAKGYVDLVVYGMLAEDWNSADRATFV